MKEIQGDILQGIATSTDKVVVLHGCNCMHIMGGGIALYLRRKFPEVFEADLNTEPRKTVKLGTYSVAAIRDTFHVANCYTQFGIQPDVYNNPPVDYNAIKSCLRSIAKVYVGWEIRLPRIGCGLAGGDWDIVRSIIQEELAGQNYAIYYL